MVDVAVDNFLMLIDWKNNIRSFQVFIILFSVSNVDSKGETYAEDAIQNYLRDESYRK